MITHSTKRKNFMKKHLIITALCFATFSPQSQASEELVATERFSANDYEAKEAWIIDGDTMRVYSYPKNQAQNQNAEKIHFTIASLGNFCPSSKGKIEILSLKSNETYSYNLSSETSRERKTKQLTTLLEQISSDNAYNLDLAYSTNEIEERTVIRKATENVIRSLFANKSKIFPAAPSAWWYFTLQPKKHDN